jgi:hypothetical protein
MPGGIDSWVGRLSIVGARGVPPSRGIPEILARSRRERTLPVVSANLGLPCPESRAILARQLLAVHQWDEIRPRFEAIPMKGLDLAHRLYPSPSLRDMGDIDLLVRPSRLREADGALRGLGYVPSHDAVRLAGSGSTLNAVEYARDDGSMPVHLHWHVSNASLPHFMYRVDVDEVWRESTGGAMASHHRVVTLCEHALKHSFSELIHLTDIELAARGVDAALVAETSRRWGLERAVFYAAALLRDLAGVVSPALGRVRLPSPGWDGRAFLACARRRRWDGLSALGLLSMARGWRGKARFVLEALVPARGGSEGLRTRTLGGRVGRAIGMVCRGLTSPA